MRAFDGDTRVEVYELQSEARDRVRPSVGGAKVGDLESKMRPEPTRDFASPLPPTQTGAFLLLFAENQYIFSARGGRRIWGYFGSKRKIGSFSCFVRVSTPKWGAAGSKGAFGRCPRVSGELQRIQ